MAPNDIPTVAGGSPKDTALVRRLNGVRTPWIASETLSLDHVVCGPDWASTGLPIVGMHNPLLLHRVRS